MTAPTRPLNPRVARNLMETLARLRKARAEGLLVEAMLAEKRLNSLLDNKVPRPGDPTWVLLGEVDRQAAEAKRLELLDVYNKMSRTDPRRSELARQIIRLPTLANPRI